MARILIIDDELDCLVLLKTLLSQAGHDVFPLMRPTRFLEEIRQVNPELVITDIMMPGITGGSIYQAIRDEISADLPIIVSSGTKMRLKLPGDPMLAYCPKPLNIPFLLSTVENLLNAARKSQSDKSRGDTDFKISG